MLSLSSGRTCQKSLMQAMCPEKKRHITSTMDRNEMNLKRLYPEAVKWGRTNSEQHAALQALWLQYDHVLPHSRGGDNSIDNVVITCAPCNYVRMDNLVSEMGLRNPFSRPPMQSDWDGLERLLESIQPEVSTPFASSLTPR